MPEIKKCCTCIHLNAQNFLYFTIRSFANISISNDKMLLNYNCTIHYKFLSLVEDLLVDYSLNIKL